MRDERGKTMTDNLLQSIMAGAGADREAGSGSELHTTGSEVHTTGSDVHITGSEVHTTGSEVHTAGSVLQRGDKSPGPGYPWRVDSLPHCGRVLIATRDIAPFELVIADSALALVPNDVPVCLGCLGQVTKCLV